MSNAIDIDRVRHIGVLSRIELTDTQARELAGQLGAIVEYFDKLNELDTDGVEPMAHAMETHNVLADDVPAESLSPDEALTNAAERDDNFFKVPKVIGDS
ncbi:MAG: Asp-tRNA(Asn)/Glu-tRNA(Gln) amidotransferase subunit GatC [Phycisphaerae bacterium]|jgi:aspartyl-tRNA(Asn)/glutamyl-tRNA(Gln) amidotransferase subunit C|nr:Asp-tRNA(Asn)/Glu-tRNA(Gln) amidotransferase subunit GatC [Phycisphaerae bacterium]